MAETPATPVGKFLAVIGHIGAIAAVVALIAGAFGYILSAPGWFVGFCAGVCLLGVTMLMAWRVSLGSESPIETIREWRSSCIPPSNFDLVRRFDTPRETRPEQPSGGLSLEEMKENNELKKLHPNFIEFGSEYVEAHNDDSGVIVRGDSAFKCSCGNKSKTVNGSLSRLFSSSVLCTQDSPNLEAAAKYRETSQVVTVKAPNVLSLYAHR